MAVIGTWDEVAAQVNSTEQTLDCLVKFAGVAKTASQIEIVSAYDQLCTECNIVVQDTTGIVINQLVEVWQGYNGYITKTFTGYVDEISTTEFPTEKVVRCRDVLKRLSDNFMVSDGAATDAYRTFNQILAEDTIEFFLTDSKLTNYNLGSTGYYIGDPVRSPAYEWRVNAMPAANAAQEVCDVVNWHLWADVDGEVQFQNLDPTPAETATWTYSDGSGLLATNSGGIKKLQVSVTDENLRNKVIILGFDATKAVRKETADILPDGFYKAVVMASDLFDTQETCDWLADRTIYELNRLTSYVNGTVIGNPCIQMGDTVQLNVTEMETLLGLTGKYFVYGINSKQTSTEWTMELSLFQGVSSDWIPLGLGGLGTPDFTYRIVRYGDPFWMLWVDARIQPSTFRGDIRRMTVTWNWGDGTPDGTGLYTVHRYNTAGTYTVTMTVRNRVGRTASVSKNITIGTAADDYLRVLWGAGSGYALLTRDSGATFTQNNIPGVNLLCVTADPDNGNNAMFGANNGKIYKTTDKLVTLTPQTIRLGDPVTAIWQDRQYTTEFYAGTQDGYLYHSSNSGLLWTLVNTITGPIVFLVTVPGVPSSIYVGHETSISHSPDSGVTLGTVKDFGVDVNDVALQNYMNTIVVATDTRPQMSVDAAFSWLSANVSGLMTCVTASAFNYNAALVSKANLLYKTIGLGLWPLQHTFAAGLQLTDMAYDGDIVDVVYGSASLSTGHGILMSWNDGVTWKYLKNTSTTCNQIAYGPLILTDVTSGMYFTPGGQSGGTAAGELWKLSASNGTPELVWTAPNTPEMISAIAPYSVNGKLYIFTYRSLTLRTWDVYELDPTDDSVTHVLGPLDRTSLDDVGVKLNDWGSWYGQIPISIAEMGDYLFVYFKYINGYPYMMRFNPDTYAFRWSRPAQVFTNDDGGGVAVRNNILYFFSGRGLWTSSNGIDTWTYWGSTTIGDFAWSGEFIINDPDDDVIHLSRVYAYRHNVDMLWHYPLDNLDISDILTNDVTINEGPSGVNAGHSFMHATPEYSSADVSLGLFAVTEGWDDFSVSPHVSSPLVYYKSSGGTWALDTSNITASYNAQTHSMLWFDGKLFLLVNNIISDDGYSITEQNRVLLRRDGPDDWAIVQTWANYGDFNWGDGTQASYVTPVSISGTTRKSHEI